MFTQDFKYQLDWYIPIGAYQSTKDQYSICIDPTKNGYQMISIGFGWYLTFCFFLVMSGSLGPCNTLLVHHLVPILYRFNWLPKIYTELILKVFCLGIYTSWENLNF